MKRIISLTLVLLMLVTLTLTATSCEFSLESKTGYTQLRDHIEQVMEEDQDQDEVSLTAIENYTIVATVASGEIRITLNAVSEKEDRTTVLVLNGSVEKASLEYKAVSKTGETVNFGKADVLLTHYTGSDLIEFTEIQNFMYELDHRKNATNYLNSILKSLDSYMNENLDLNVRDLGFIVLSDKYMASTGEVEVEEDLGGAFSSARLQLAGLMILIGIGMVFLVLAILWMVLVIFKMIFAKDSANAEKAAKAAAKAATKAEKEAAKAVDKEAEKAVDTPAPAPVSAPASDDQLIAVITAAVAAAIEADPALSSQFASGFRVVSFKKTDKSRTR